MPRRVRKSVNVLLCLVAVAGIGWSGREIWQVWQGRHQIDEACAGIVPAGRVLALSPAGGTLSHRQADEGTIELDAGLPQDCEIFSTEAGEKHGTSSGERWFFTGTVGALPEQSVVTDDPLEELVDFNGDPTYPVQPLGGGVAGVVGDTGVMVQLPCPKGRSNGVPVTDLWARAELMDPGPHFTEKGQLGAHDRQTLAKAAVTMANRLAERLGCAERLPDPPADIPALTEGPVPAARADGTCAWYGKAGFSRRPGLPDQVLQSRTDDRLWDESCGLVLSGSRARSLWLAGTKDHEHLISPKRPGQYFVSLHTYAGEEATTIRLSRTDYDEPADEAEPGKAGRSSEEPVWWASSECDGRPQIHTMTVAYGYDDLMTPVLEKVFRAYVTDVTERRGCSQVKFPAASTFHSDPDAA
ncbi:MULTISPECIES: hypothetical protein [unclassified Streptomyces]|uniref:hypothetical protein n=1 Tax=unclassified Streptomyces TaxID=2593676 RepID=UPI002DDAC437|nr:hypothetical protein [Streptomyces sp. NBC_01445]WSE06347.1 hypothetical protein OG574_25170 [Streptomyces sp. NBC_01445]